MQVDLLIGNPKKAREKLGWNPTKTPFKELVQAAPAPLPTPLSLFRSLFCLNRKSLPAEFVRAQEMIEADAATVVKGVASGEETRFTSEFGSPKKSRADVA